MSSEPAPRVLPRETLALHRRAEAVLRDAERAAGALREQAAIDAQVLVDDAQRKVARLLDDAAIEVALRIAAAEDDARQIADRAECDASAQRTARLAQTELALEEFRNEQRDALLSLAMRVAGTFVAERSIDDERIVGRALDEALARVGATSLFTVRVAPNDFLTVAGRLGEARVRADDSLRSPDVVVETQAGRVDARLATRLDTLLRALGGAP